MSIQKTDKKMRRGLYRLEAVVFAILYSLYCFVIFPLTVYVADDVAFENTPLADVLSYLGSVSELVAIAVAYAITVFGIYKLGKKSMGGASVIFAVATLLKYTANTLIYWGIYGSIPLEWAWDIGNVIFYTALETVQLLIVVAVTNSVAGRYPLTSDADGNMKFKSGRLYDKDNGLMRAALWCAVISVASKVFGALADDIFIIISTGLPQKAITWVLMLLNYLSNVIFGVACYFVMLLVIIKLAEKYGAKSD